MKDVVRIKDKSFEKFISESEINQAIEKIANEINKDLEGKDPLFVCVLVRLCLLPS